MRTTKLILLALLIYLNGCIQIALPPVDDYITILISLAGVKKTSSTPTQQAPTPTSEPMPPTISYSGSPFVLILNLPINTITPTITGAIESCVSNPTLPTGLSLDNTTCAISGTPTTVQSAANYTITASNSGGNTTTTISFTVNAPVAGVSLVATSTVPFSGTVTLTPVFTPSNASNQNVTWSSSNTSVATVSNGTVTGVAIGTATITVTTADGGYTGTCLVTVPVTIGLLYAGGMVFYVDGTGLHGLVAATTDQSTGKVYGIAVNNPQPIGTGSSNTNAIIAANGGLNTNYAAGVARSYTGGGYNDWFLPSLGEAAEMALKIGYGGGNIGSFTNANYWTSSKNFASPNYYNPITSGINMQSTSIPARVRAIRAF